MPLADLLDRTVAGIGLWPTVQNGVGFMVGRSRLGRHNSRILLFSVVRRNDGSPPL